MGKIKQRYNAKARKLSREVKSKVNNRPSIQDKPIENQEKLEINESGSNIEYSTVLEPNPEIIKPVNKEKRAKEVNIENAVSKRKRKQLEKIKEKRQKSAKVFI